MLWLVVLLWLVVQRAGCVWPPLFLVVVALPGALDKWPTWPATLITEGKLIIDTVLDRCRTKVW